MSTWQQLKSEHVALSDAAADRYDEFYADANFATGAYMQYEHDVIAESIKLCQHKNIALDLGCGTGRHSFLLAKHFDQVFAYDFSRQMLAVAERAKLKKHVGNCFFEYLDVEQERLPVQDGSVALVNTGFGMGSFLESPEVLFREIRRVLQPGGVAVFSFYNAEALVNRLELLWTPALAARAKIESAILEVNFEGRTYEIPAKAYRTSDIRKRLGENFVVHQLTTFPTLSALFPQDLFVSEHARALCTEVDRLLATNTEIAAGPYIVAVTMKKGWYEPPEPLGYPRVMELLARYRLTPDVLEHEPVKTMEDVKRVLTAEPKEMVKSVLIAVDKSGVAKPQGILASLYLCAIPADRKLDLAKLAALIGVSRQQVRFATQEEVEELTGFKAGSIPPFGLPRKTIVLLDTALTHFQKVWCGTGRATESLRISIDNLKRISSATVVDITKGG